MSAKIKVSVFLGISLGGYIAGPDNDLSWMSLAKLIRLKIPAIML